LSRAGVVVALAAEARAWSPAPARGLPFTTLDDGTLLAVSGVGYRAAASTAALLLDAGVDGLISLGLAGGLDPALRAGCLLLPDAVSSADGPDVIADALWRARVIRTLPPSQTAANGRLWTSLTPVLTVEAKRRLYADSGALAVDMEGMAVGRIASGARMPFLAVKVLVDTALDALPRAAMAVDHTGRVRAGQLAGTLLRHPGEIIALMRLARRYYPAQRTLRRTALFDALRQPTAETTIK
jgi:adenosylhomocysteine nucleosidase